MRVFCHDGLFSGCLFVWMAHFRVVCNQVVFWHQAFFLVVFLQIDFSPDGFLFRWLFVRSAFYWVAKNRAAYFRVAYFRVAFFLFFGRFLLGGKKPGGLIPGGFFPGVFFLGGFVGWLKSVTPALRVTGKTKKTLIFLRTHYVRFYILDWSMVIHPSHAISEQGIGIHRAAAGHQRAVHLTAPKSKAHDFSSEFICKCVFNVKQTFSFEEMSLMVFTFLFIVTCEYILISPCAYERDSPCCYVSWGNKFIKLIIPDKTIK